MPASGFARAEAAAQGVDLGSVTASRADGFVTSGDLASGSAAAPVGGSTYQPGPGVIHATPTARMEAKKNNIDLASLQGKGSGVLGRVTQEDVLRAAGKWVEKVKPAAAADGGKSASGAAAQVEVKDGVVAMDGMQKAVAKNLEATSMCPSSVCRVRSELMISTRSTPS